MTRSERERRIKAAVESWITAPGDFVYSRMGAALDAAEEAVPTVSEAEMQRRSRIDHEAAERQHTRAKHAEAAARDFAKVLEVVARDDRGARFAARAILARHTSFSGEEGTET